MRIGGVKYLLVLSSLGLWGCSCSSEPNLPVAPLASQNSPAVVGQKPEKVGAPHLPNAYRIHQKVISGGEPDGKAAFQELKDLGVKTVISVDGAQPDVKLAAEYGLKYVHLPHGYDGVPAERGKELAKAVRDLPGPIYIHCHHGKHRSPAAATVACVGAGLLAPADAVTVLKTAGTSEIYRGLYESAIEALKLEAELMDNLKVDFRPTVELPPMADSMVHIGHAYDHLKLLSENGWKPLPDHPDLDPPHEALLLREQYTELLRTPDVQRESKPFQDMLRASEQDSIALETALRTWKETGYMGTPPTALADSFGRVSKNCKACHTDFRDVPLHEKGKK